MVTRYTEAFLEGSISKAVTVVLFAIEELDLDNHIPKILCAELSQMRE